MGEEPLTSLQEAAAQLHELFGAYVDAGFDNGQALYLVGCVISGSMRPNPPPQP